MGLQGLRSEEQTRDIAEPWPDAVTGWFAAKGWQPHAHQRDLVALAAQDRSVLLIAPTGGGKTLAGFLPSLIDLTRTPGEGLHTLYISPLKALAVDVDRNLGQPIAEADLPITHETRTGDTPPHKRQRQKKRPPNLLLTTPESLALLLSYADARAFFRKLRAVIVDELHALAGTKRGELLSLGLARLAGLAPHCRFVGLSATVADPAALGAWLPPGPSGQDTVILKAATRGAAPQIDVLDSAQNAPWGGHMALHALPDVYEQIKRHRTTLVFVNTRAQAEMVFQGLWRMNEETLAIALHHGSLSKEQRRKVEAAMSEGKLKAVVATSSLDLGIDWASVDLVIQMGAPKGAARLVQRIGRANHRLEEASRAKLVPGNRFELLECMAAIEAVAAGALDGDPPRPGGLDVLAQHILGAACSEPQDPEQLYTEIRTAPPYAALDRETFRKVFGFVADGGYALGRYEDYRRLEQDPETGRWGPARPTVVRRYRQNVGTIVEAPLLKVRLSRSGRGGKVLGEVEEYFALALSPGDTFLFAGRLLAYQGLQEGAILCTPASGKEPKIPAYAGGRLPLSTLLADRVLGILSDANRRALLPAPVRQWLDIQARRSELPRAGHLLVETFPRAGRHFLVAYCFAGRNAHQTLGMLLTRRYQRARCRPLGFVASDYAVALWSGLPPPDPETLFNVDLLGDDLEEWLAETPMIKRVFRRVAVIAGLIHRKTDGQEKSGRQVTFNADLIYDVLRRYEPDHVLLRAARDDAMGGMIDISRLSHLLHGIQGRIEHRALARVSPLAVPVMLDIGKESTAMLGMDDLLGDAEAEALIADAERVDLMDMMDVMDGAP
ncbi:MAG: ligase-associated DNA damage response DEXH box helicase [Rhodospirillaceae bacterium]